MAGRKDRMTRMAMALFASACLIAPSAHAGDQGALDTSFTGYPRVVRLANGDLLATASEQDASDALSNRNPIYRKSGNQGWGRVGTVATGQGPVVDGQYDDRYSCCSALYVLPAASGGLAAGTVLLGVRSGGAARDDGTGYGDGDVPDGHIDIYASTDNGTTFQPLSTLPITGALWEVDFHLAADGTLVAEFSWEHNGLNHDQLIVHYTSSDGGQSWQGQENGDPITDVAVGNGGRPGMPRVTRVGGGGYVMSYEACSYDNCFLHTKTSADGLDWGTGDGPRVVSNRGNVFQNTSDVVWSPAGADGGTLIAVARRLTDTGGNTVSADETNSGTGGTVMFTTDLSGATGWTEAAAPFFVAGTDQSDPCEANYSPTLLPSTDGQTLLMVAQVRESATQCTVHVGEGTAPGL